MTEFEQMIAAQRAAHEAAQRTPVFIHSKKNVTAGPADITHVYYCPSAAETYGMQKAHDERRQSEILREHLSQDDYYRLSIVPPMVDLYIGFVAASIYDLIDQSNVISPGITAVMKKLNDAMCYLYGYFSRGGDQFADAVKSVRYLWHKKGHIVRHITMLKDSYYAEIINSPFRYSDANANDLMAWTYTARALCHEEYRFIEVMMKAFQKNDPKDKHKARKPPFSHSTNYGVHQALGDWLTFCHWPMDIESKRVSLARDIMLNQMRLAPVLQYNDELPKLYDIA